MSAFDDTIRLLTDLYHGPILPASEARLERIRFLLRELGDPHTSFTSVHVAGSSGKGSTTTMIGSILQASGVRTGYFRSPHLQSFRERIAVDGRDIDEGAWVDLFWRVWPVAAGMRDGTYETYSLGRPAFFEVLFAMAALHFAETSVAWAAVETGLGGRLDATNSLSPQVSVITNISLEHTQILGSTLTEIASEKAAIIKSGSIAVTAEAGSDPLAIISNRAAAVGAPLWRVGDEITLKHRGPAGWTQPLTLTGPGMRISVRLPLAGEVQATNAATAFGAALAASRRGAPVDERTAIEGLETVRVPGRLERLSDRPLVVADGAHNPHAISRLAASLPSLMGGRRVVMLFAAMRDKNVKEMAAAIAPVVDAAIVTRVPGSERSADPEDVAGNVAALVGDTTVVPDPERALSEAIARTGADDVLLVTGSLYLVGLVRSHFRAEVAV